MSTVFSSASSEVDVSIWRAIVGTAVKTPPVNTYVYYFPQGHLEQSSSSSDNPINYNFTLQHPWIPCRVLSINFLANSFSDQAYVRMLLQPHDPRPTGNGRDATEDDNDVVSFVKILTHSDAYSSGGLTIPKCCALTILPPLDHTVKFPSQILVFRDAHNTLWEFRHIYRGTPPRHLLTMGWCKFVEAKCLVSGDSVVLIKKRSTNEFFIGIRRASNDIDRLEALAAIAASRRGMAFAVSYYPKVGVPIFVVKAEKVDETLRRRWTVGMRVRMAGIGDGVVEAVMMPNRGVWCGSPWRMLKVNWEEPGITQHVRRVSPWEVECITLSPLIDSDRHTSKILRALQDSRTLPLHIMEPTRSIVGQSSSSVFHDRDTTITSTIGDSSTSFQLFGKTIKMSRS